MCSYCVKCTHAIVMCQDWACMLFKGKQTVWTECKTKGQQLENLRRVYSIDIFKDPFKVPTVYMEDKNASVASSMPIAKRLPTPPWCFCLSRFKIVYLSLWAHISRLKHSKNTQNTTLRINEKRQRKTQKGLEPLCTYAQPSYHSRLCYFIMFCFYCMVSFFHFCCCIIICKI